MSFAHTFTPPAPLPLGLLLTLLLAAPVAEELVFRAGVQEQLQRRGWPARRAVLVSSGAFAIAHGLARSWALGAAVLLPSLCLGALYAGRRAASPARDGLWPCIGLHAAFNALWLVAGASFLTSIGFAA